MSRRPHPVLAVLLLALVGCSIQPDVHQQASPSDQPILFDNLGSYHQTITTSSPKAQAYFDQGLRLVYAFNHLEAQRAFREAAFYRGLIDEVRAGSRNATAAGLAERPSVL